MQMLNDLLVGMLGPLGPVIAAGGLGVLLLLASIPVFIGGKKDPLEKLKETKGGQAGSGGKRQSLRQESRQKQLEKFSEFLEPQNEEEYSAIRLKLMRAGYRTKDAVRLFHFAQMALGILLLAAGVVYVYSGLAGEEPDAQKPVLYILGPGGAGYFLPKYWITRRIEERKEALTNGFPDALDMLLVCVEAGQSLDQAIIRVAKEIRPSYPDLADEFQIVSYEIKAGKDKALVLGDMATRCDVTDISSFVTVLIQSSTFGTSIADALRVYAGEMRDKRVMRAEEKANKLPTKMTLATMKLTVPPLLIILVGPSVVGITELGNMNETLGR